MARKKRNRENTSVARSPRRTEARQSSLLPPSAPYDPLDLRTLAESMMRVVLEQPIHTLTSLESFAGSGIYVLYYTGDFKAYKPIVDKNRDQWEGPIYVGEATRKGGRKGGVLAEGPPGKAIFDRLRNHEESIRQVSNLDVEDFWCRYLALKDFFIPLCESLLIDKYEPIWNKLIDGFGNKVLGGRRQPLQQKSMWDVLHPGRRGAGISENKKYPNAESVVNLIQKFFARKPVPLIPTDQAVEAAEKSGKMQSNRSPKN